VEMDEIFVGGRQGARASGRGERRKKFCGRSSTWLRA
jgi:hypothetical protein